MEESRNKEETMIVQSDFLPSRVKVTYKGSARPLHRSRRSFFASGRCAMQVIRNFIRGRTRQKCFLWRMEQSTGWRSRRSLYLRIQQEFFHMGEKVDLFLLRYGHG